MQTPFPFRLEVNAEDPDQPHLTLRDDEGHVGAGQITLDLSRPLGDALDWLQFLWNYRLGQGSEADAIAFGTDLATILFGEGSLATARAAIDGAAGGRPLELTLALGAGSERFAALPLELLRDSQGFVFGRAGAALNRTLLEAPAQVVQLPRQPRVLMAWACPPGTGRFDPAPHVASLSAVFGDQLVVVAEASFDAITRALREAHLQGKPFDMLHVLAHGAADMGSGGICLTRPTGGLHRVGAEPFAAGLRGMGLSLAFFCSCMSAVAGPGSSFTGAGQQALAEMGGDLPCVVAAQANLPVQGSAALAERFYRGLSAGLSPTRALSDARQTAFVDGGLAWSAPVLFVRPQPAAPQALVGVDTANLPIRKESWQDRPQLVREGRELMERGRLVSVVGLPGMGKSELGMELARKAQQDGLVDRVLFLPVQRGHSAAAVRARVATALGMAAVPSDDRQLAGALLGIPQRLLLLLDDAEGLLRDRETARATRAQLDALLDLVPRLRVLLTTRWQVGNTRESERTLRVSTLDALAGEKLLEAEIRLPGAWKDSFRGEAEWARLLEMLDGHPRSTVLIARHFTLPGASARQIVRRLETLRAAAVVEPDLLGQPDGALDDGERSRLESLVASMDMSFDVLREQCPSAVSAFAALSLFAAGLPEEVATAVSGDGGVGLMQLLRLNLIEWREGRTRYPLPVRWYAERVRKSVALDETKTRREALEAFASLAHGWYQAVLAGKTATIVAAVLAEEQNLLELAAWADEHGDTTEGPSSLARVARYVDSALTLAGRMDTRRALLSSGLRCARRVGDRLGEATMLRHLGDLEVQTDSPKEAVELTRASLAIARELGDAHCTAGALRAMGDALARMDDEDGAKAAFLESIEHYRKNNSALGEANAQRSLGELCTRINELDVALAALGRALALFEGLGDLVGEGNVRITRADTHAMRNDLVAARDDAKRALQVYQEARALVGEANALRVLSELHHRSGDLLRADEMLRRGLTISREMHDRLGEANALRALGSLRMQQDERAEARQALTLAMALFAEVRATLSEGSCCVSMAELLLLEGRLEEAEAHVERALVLYREARSALGEANALSLSGELKYRRNKLAEAEAALNRSLELHEQIGMVLGMTTVLRRLADIARAQGNLPKATEILARAAKTAEATGSDLDRGTIALKQAEVAMLMGDLQTGYQGAEGAEALYRRADSTLGVANAKMLKADCLRMSGDRSRSVQEAEAALALYREISDGPGIANALIQLAVLTMEEGAPSAAFALGLEAKAAYERNQDTGGVGRAHELLARCALTLGAVAKCLVLSEPALAAYRALGDPTSELGLLYLQFQALQAGSDPPGVLATAMLLRAGADRFNDNASYTWWASWLGQVKDKVPAELFAAAEADPEGLRVTRIAEARRLLEGADPYAPPA